MLYRTKIPKFAPCIDPHHGWGVKSLILWFGHKADIFFVHLVREVERISLNGIKLSHGNEYTNE